MSAQQEEGLGAMLVTASLVPMALCIPLHITVAIVFVKYRKEVFTAAFFTLATSLLIGDALLCAWHLIQTIFSVEIGIGVIYDGDTVIYHWKVIISLSVLFVLRNANLFGITVIGINRFMFLLYAPKAENFWTHKCTLAVLAGQWSLALISGVSHQPSMEIVRDNESNIVGLAPPIGKASFWMILSIVAFLGCAVTIVLVYACMFVKLYKHNKETGVLLGGSGSAGAEIKMAVQGFVLTIFLLPTAFENLWMLLAPPPGGDVVAADFEPPPHPLIIDVNELVKRANYFTTSLVLLVLSPTLRVYVRKLFGIKPNAVGNAATNAPPPPLPHATHAAHHK